MYIRLYELYLRLGGDPEPIQQNSPIERTLAQFFRKRKCLPRQAKENPTTASTLSANELFESTNLPPNLSTWEYMQSFEDKIDKLVLIRRRLVRAVEVIELLVSREQTKFENLKSLID